MKYFHKFNSQQEFDEAYNGSEYTQPWVSYTVEGKEIDYNKHSKEYWRNFSSPFTIEALGTGEITWALGPTTLSYSKNNGDWELMTSGVSIPVVEGDIIQFKGNNNMYSGSKISSTANFNVKGNIASLVSENNYTTNNIEYSNSVFANLFTSCDTIINASNLILPATNLSGSCFYEMFMACTNLISAPKLSATILSYNCYKSMFEGCTSLTNVPELPALVLANACYQSMFKGCTSLTSIPENLLPANTLIQACYYRMFQDCTGLTEVPNNLLHATELATTCYGNMFNGCTNLVVAPYLPATTLAQDCYFYMFYKCSKLNYVKAMFIENNGVQGWLKDVSTNGTFVKNINATWNDSDIVPSGWTIQTAEPDD